MEPPKKLITRILEGAFMLALSAWLVRLAVCWILEVWPVLLAIALATIAVLVAYRIWRHKRDDLGKW